jgi:ABC-type sulfate transport system permease component
VVADEKLLPSLRELIAMLTTFTLTVFAWIFFRAENLNHAFSFIGGVFSKSIFETPKFSGISDSLIIFCFLVFFIFLEWLGRKDKFAIEKIFDRVNKNFRIILYLVLTILIIKYFFENGKASEFIYFQF